MRYVIVCLISWSFCVASDNSFAQLKAGTAKVDITPPIGVAMEGFGPRKAEGVHDPLYARALVLTDGTAKLAIVTLDLALFYETSPPTFRDPNNYGFIGSYTNVKKVVKTATGIEKVLCVASHTHSGPEPIKPWLNEMERRVAGAISEAASALVPAQIGVGWGEVREGFNRRCVKDDGTVVKRWSNPQHIVTAPLDNDLGVIRIQMTSGKTIATLVNYACHPVVLGAENKMLSADYPGVLARKVEEAMGGQCMFLEGAAGDIDPFLCLLSAKTGGLEELDRMGTVIANEVLRVSKRINSFQANPRLSVHTESVALASRLDVDRKTRKISAEVNTVLIGDELALATFPGEFFVEHGLSLKRRSRIKNTMFVGYCNDVLGYFPTIEASLQGGYGAVWSMWAWTEVGAGEMLVNRALINLGYQAGLFQKAEAKSQL
jgi:neutral ceramidase